MDAFCSALSVTGLPECLLDAGHRGAHSFGYIEPETLIDRCSILLRRRAWRRTENELPDLDVPVLIVVDGETVIGTRDAQPHAGFAIEGSLNRRYSPVWMPLPKITLEDE